MQCTVLTVGGLAAATTAIFLLFGVFPSLILCSGACAVIQVGRTLFLSPEFKASISLITGEQSQGPRLLAFLIQDSKSHILIIAGTVGLFVLGVKLSFRELRLGDFHKVTKKLEAVARSRYQVLLTTNPRSTEAALGELGNSSSQ